MENKDKKKYIKELFRLKYTILRRAIFYKTYTLDELKNLCYQLEGKDLKELKKIHKKWIGYY